MPSIVLGVHRLEKQPVSDRAYRFAHYRLVPAQRMLLAQGSAVRLGGRAFDMLVALIERRDRTVSKSELLDLVWPHVIVEENNLQAQVMALRKLFGHGAIATVPGRGYRFTWPVEVDGAGAAPPVADAPAPCRPGVLPNPAPELVGRDAELHMLQRLLDQHRVVTVAGAGGIGKTRLAEGVAAARQPRETDGVWWVELAGLSDPTLVPTAVARALDLPLSHQADAMQAVLKALHGRAALLVLDNAEHLVEAVACFVAAVRQQAARVRILVTSQEVLRALDEQVFRPGPLSLPLGDELAQVRASGAVALFVARVRAADPRFELDGHNHAAVADICRRLDGIPLAIELAAARVPLLGIEGVRRRLDERFQLLTAGHRAVLRRHQTLRAALAWSHGLLDAKEQRVFRRLGVFASGFTLEAAQALVEEEPDLDAWEAIECLGALVDKSLVVAEGHPVPRYRLLETTRLYALERLAEASETQTWLMRHAQLLLTEADTQAAAIERSGIGAGPLARLDAERDNLLHALDWCARSDDPGAAALGQRLVTALRHWYSARAQVPLGLRHMQRALDRASALPVDVARVKLLLAASQAANWIGHYDTASRLGHEALAMASACGDREGEATARLQLGHVAMDAGRLDEAQAHLQAARDAGHALNHCRITGGALNGLAALATERGQLDDGWSLVREEISQRRLDGHAANLTGALFNGAMIALVRDDAAAARPLLSEGAALLQQLDSRFMGQLFIELVAPWLAQRQCWRDAVLFYGAASAQMRQMSLPPNVLLAARQQKDLLRARAVLPEEEVTAAWNEGRGLDVALTQRRAIALLDEPLRPDDDPGAPGPRAPQPGR